MENMITVKGPVIAGIGAVGSVIASFFGGWDAALITLLVMYASNPPTLYPLSSKPFKMPFVRSMVPLIPALGFRSLKWMLKF